MVQRRAGPGMIVQQEVQVESKEKCKRCARFLRRSETYCPILLQANRS